MAVGMAARLIWIKSFILRMGELRPRELWIFPKLKEEVGGRDGPGLEQAEPQSCVLALGSLERKFWHPPIIAPSL